MLFISYLFVTRVYGCAREGGKAREREGGREGGRERERESARARASKRAREREPDWCKTSRLESELAFS